MVDRIVKVSNNEVVVIYWDRPAITFRSDNGTALYYAVEILNLDKELPCTTLQIALK